MDPPRWWRRLFEGRRREDSADGVNNDFMVAGPIDVVAPELGQ